MTSITVVYILLVAVAVITCAGAFSSSSTTASYNNRYELGGYLSDCWDTVYLDPGSTIRITAWTSADGGDYATSCPIYFETTHYNPSNPRFKYKFDWNEENYINDCDISLEIFDSRSTSSPEHTYNCNSYLPTSYETTVYSEYFTVKLDSDDFSSRDFDFTLIVSLEYDSTSTTYTVNWYVIVWPLLSFVIIVSVVAGVARSCHHRQLAHSRATRAAAGTPMLSTSNCAPQPYATAPPPSYPAQPQPYPSGPQPYPSGPQPYPAQPQACPTQPQAYPTQPQAYPTQPQAYPTQPQAYPTQPQAYPTQPQTYSTAPPTDGNGFTPPPKYEDVAPSYAPAS